MRPTTITANNSDNLRRTDVVPVGILFKLRAGRTQLTSSLLTPSLSSVCECGCPTDSTRPALSAMHSRSDRTNAHASCPTRTYAGRRAEGAPLLLYALLMRGVCMLSPMISFRASLNHVKVVVAVHACTGARHWTKKPSVRLRDYVCARLLIAAARPCARHIAFSTLDL